MCSSRAARLKISHCAGNIPGSFSVIDGRRAIVAGIGPAVVRHDRRPAGPAGILVVRIAAEAPIELAVLGELIAVELYAESRILGYADRAVFIFHETAFDDIVRQVMIVRVGRE